LVTYEFLITFSNEIEIVWRRPITARAVLLGSVRWCMLLANVANLAPTTTNVSLECFWPCAIRDNAYYRSKYSLFKGLRAAVFSALRVFAVRDKSYVWSLITFALGMVPFATNMVCDSYN
ncbi:uncharacterized protein PHACADRAFT_108583, partial [Phanerochaete carnosa HHB-10118-sp]